MRNYEIENYWNKIYKMYENNMMLKDLKKTGFTVSLCKIK